MSMVFHPDPRAFPCIEQLMLTCGALEMSPDWSRG
jgi:hypothetical protein